MINTIWIPDERPMGWNKLNTRAHWTRRKEEAKRCHDLVVLMARSLGIEPIKGRVDIRITAYYTGRAYDSDNINAKFYIDGLHPEIIPDDTPDYVRWVSTRSIKRSKDPGLLIEIEPVISQAIPGSFDIMCNYCKATFGSIGALIAHVENAHIN